MKKLMFTVLAAALVLGLFYQAGAKAKSDGNVFFTDDKGQKHFLCPVLGNMGVVAADTKYSDFDGKRYYFCCPACLPKFEADPAKYVKALNLPGNVIKMAGEDTYFVCPVTGEEAMLAADTKFTDYQGKRYYFCCESCPADFAKSPDKYVKNVNKKMSHDHSKCGSCASPCEKKGM